MVIQMAKGRGAEVTAVDSTEKLGMLRSIGADHVIDYTQTDFTQVGQTYDVIIDVVGKSSVARTLRSLSENGRYYLGNPSLSQRFQARRASTGSKRILHGTGSQAPEGLAHLRGLIEAGQLRPVIDRTFPLEQMADAHRYVDQGHKKGNVAVTVEHSH
jgi:NADPH:quinone reductase-like Zn-dependent oxidoreductase